jgi:hypothetical protein
MVAPHPERNKTEADLSKANFSKPSLRYWNLSKTDLTRANLTGAGLRDANLSGARPPIGPVVSQGVECLNAVQIHVETSDWLGHGRTPGSGSGRCFRSKT